MLDTERKQEFIAVEPFEEFRSRAHTAESYSQLESFTEFISSHPSPMEKSMNESITESEHPCTDKQTPLLESPISVRPNSDDAAEKTSKKSPGCLVSSLGVVLGLTAGFSNSLVAVLVKVIKTVGIFEIAVFRYVIMLVPLIATLACKRMNPFQWDLVRSRGWVLVLRAVVGLASTYCKYFALRKLPLADASVIIFSSPVFATLLARVFLKEKFRWIHGVAILLSLTGCILVSRPTFIFGNAAYNPNSEWDDHMWGCLAALASAVFAASVFVTVRHMKDMDSTIVLFWTAFVGLIISLVATAAVDHFVFPTDPLEFGYILGVGILTLISQESLTRSLRLESAGLISLIRTGDIAWFFIWQIILFQVMPHYFSITGALLVVFCVIFVSLREAGEKMPEDSRLGRAVRKVNQKVDSITCRSLCCKKKEPLEMAEVSFTTP